MHPNLSHTRAVLANLRGTRTAPRKRKVGRVPRPLPPTRIGDAYTAAIVRDVCSQARECFDRERGEILSALTDLRRMQGHTDAAPRPIAGGYRGLVEGLSRAFAGCERSVIGSTFAGPILAFTLPGPRPVVIVTGQHGEEQAGPLMLARHGATLVARAKRAGVGLRVYPCANPEGFDAGTRRDLDGDTRANSFVEYLVGGTWRGDLDAGMESQSSRRPKQAPETAALYDDLAAFVQRTSPSALIDLHQDSILRAGYAFGYLNAGPREAVARVLARAAIPFARRRLANGSWTRVRVSTGSDGLATFRDGSVTDWAAMVGIPIAVAFEAPLWNDAATLAIDRALVRGVIDLASPPRLDAADPAPKPKRETGIGADFARATQQGERAARAIDRAAAAFAQEFNPRALHEVVKHFGKRTDEHSRAQLDQQLRTAIGVPLSAIEKPHRDRIDEWAALNVDLIVTVPERYFDRLRLDVEDAFEGGTHPDTLADDFAERYDMSERDAERIARDQTLKLSADLNHDRYEAMGVEEAIWETVADGRVCDDCAAMQGVQFTLAEGADGPCGPGSLPGGCHPQDRCWSRPLLGDLINGVDSDSSP